MKNKILLLTILVVVFFLATCIDQKKTAPQVNPLKSNVASTEVVTSKTFGQVI